ncbi:MAG: hypothetical protein CMA12_02965 [Euryarchaeota archaeon]|nr:hypothetical protein [Euryarchaeota archaeon]OUW22653.1 MAG: hypothetical protein CBD33_01535 [Euryarchaeota archaeon TMED173]
MMLRIGLDDTDHVEVGCTTKTMDDFLRYMAANLEVSIIERRLVRLWPFARRRTRGNGALGAIVDIDSSSFDEFVTASKVWFSKLTEMISTYPSTGIQPSPVLVISTDNVPEDWYWNAVRNEVDHKFMMDSALEYKCEVLHSQTFFGVVGACAAVSWNPDHYSSWELIAWRKEEAIGSPRKVSSKAVLRLEDNHKDTFLNRDPTKGKGMIAPRTPCPVLYGIRGSSETSVSNAHLWLQERSDVEESINYATHRTNQLSDDHIVSIKSGTVTNTAKETKGGHAHISVFSSGKSINLVAFNEGGLVNSLLRKLDPGDLVSWAGLESPDGSIHLERLRLDNASPRILSRPICCSRTMRSAGKGQKLRCDNCGREERKIWLCSDKLTHFGYKEGTWVEPSASNRRHLSKPLSLGNPGTI